MNNICTVINITRESEEELRIALKNAIDTNFVNYFNTSVAITKRKCKDIIFNIADTDNTINIINYNSKTGTQTTLSTLSYTPYVSKIAYKSYYDESYDLTKYISAFRYMYTILLVVTIDVNIIGFSVVSPSDLQYVKTDSQGYNIYTINQATNSTLNNVDIINVNSEEDLDNTEITHFPEQIKVQTGLINDINSYYEIDYYNLNDKNTLNYMPCIGGKCYNVYTPETNDNTLANTTITTYNISSSLINKYTDITIDNIEETESSLLLLPKLLVSDTNYIIGYTPNIFDCPSLSMPITYTDSGYNIGDIILINDSNYIIVDDNTLIKLFNTELNVTSFNGTYDGNVHFINISCPIDSEIYYNFDTEITSSTKWRKLTDINNIQLTDTEKEYGVCTSIGNWQVNYKIVVNVPYTGMDGLSYVKQIEYYGTSYVNITEATIYGYYVSNYNGTYDGEPHSIVVYMDSSYFIEYSLNQQTWYSTPIEFTDVGTYTVYYRISKNNYKTITDSALVIINAKTNTSDTTDPDEPTTDPDNPDTPGTDEPDTPIDPTTQTALTLASVNLAEGVQQRYLYYIRDDNTLLVCDYNKRISVNTNTWNEIDMSSYKKQTTQLLGGVNVTPNTCYMIVIEYPNYCLQNIDGYGTNINSFVVTAASSKDGRVSKSLINAEDNISLYCTDDALNFSIISKTNTNRTFNEHPYTVDVLGYGRTILLADLTSEDINKLDRLNFYFIYNGGTAILTSMYITLLPCTIIQNTVKNITTPYKLKVNTKLDKDVIITHYENISKKCSNIGSVYYGTIEEYKNDSYTIPYNLIDEGSYSGYIYDEPNNTSTNCLTLSPQTLGSIVLNPSTYSGVLYNKTVKGTQLNSPHYPVFADDQLGAGTLTFTLELDNVTNENDT